MYADDHQLFSVAKTTNEAESILTEEGNNISEWYNNNLLQGNFSKYQVMRLGPRNWHKDLHIVINDTVIDQKPEITPLGVTLDDQKYNFTCFSFTTNAASVKPSFFYCLYHFFLFLSLMIIYFVMIILSFLYFF